jgi:hypothetical protein
LNISPRLVGITSGLTTAFSVFIFVLVLVRLN